VVTYRDETRVSYLINANFIGLSKAIEVSVLNLECDDSSGMADIEQYSKLLDYVLESVKSISS